MLTRFAVRTQLYQDSVQLMSISDKLRRMNGIEMAAAVMGTESNLATLIQGGFMPDTSVVAGPEDIIIAVRGVDETSIDAALAAFDGFLQPRRKGEGEFLTARRPKSISGGLKQLPDANLALISVPGPYVALEALKALHAGLNVHVFSDNLPLEDEIRLKGIAKEKGLFFMGPDCGTAIINGMPLAFANVVRRGPVGIVGASGTGTQEVSVLVDRLGSGISHAIGTGGRDLLDVVGGISMLMGIEALEHDEETSVLILISKPPGHETERRIIKRVQACAKPVVVAFLGGEMKSFTGTGVYAAISLEEAAVKAVALAGGKKPAERQWAFPRRQIDELVAAEVGKIGPSRQFVRGLYSGGTLAGEAMRLLQPMVGPVAGNLSGSAVLRSNGPGHSVVDFGGDEFTRGRPHPMIDPSYRAEALYKECVSDGVAVILCDVVLGYGSHNNPAGAIAEAVFKARQDTGRYVTVVASVCGTETDPQILSRQRDVLEQAGIVVLSSNALAAEFAGKLSLACQARRNV